MNAYTYVHRGELVIDPKTNAPYEDQRRTQVCPLELKKAYTADLWERLVKASGFRRSGLNPKTWYTNWDKEIDTLKVWMTHSFQEVKDSFVDLVDFRKASLKRPAKPAKSWG